MKGIILAGGLGTNLYPITMGSIKQLLPIYDKPMIYYPLSVLMLAQIRDILIITSPNYLDNFINILGCGEHLGININYEVQSSPNGLAEAFIIGEEFIANNKVCLILGDNIFYGNGLSKILLDASTDFNGAHIFNYFVSNPERFGVPIFDGNKIISLEEKPKKPKSNYAVTGLYFYDNNVVNVAKTLKPSSRGELEITDVNLHYLNNNQLSYSTLSRGISWLDTGTHDSLLEAGQFVKTIEKRQGLKIACLEEIAYNNKWISLDIVKKQAQAYIKTSYGKYLNRIVDENT